MRIYGVDFTSAPRRQKPIVCAACDLDGSTVRVIGFDSLVDLEQLDGFLAQKGPWIAGIDFPFGQPRRLIGSLGWPASWEGYVRHVAAMDKKTFEAVLTAYKKEQPEGGKHHFREADTKAGSQSPMMLYGVPVAKMFFRGAPRLLDSPTRILPCRPTRDANIVLEAYPALVARNLIGKQSYKSDARRRQSMAHRSARGEIIQSLSSRLRTSYGLSVSLCDRQVDLLLEDAPGDHLDSVLCAVQATWAYAHRDEGYGIPAAVDNLEGWIVDPAMLR